MSKRTLALVAFIFVCIVCFGHAFYYYPYLPDKVAHHFNGSGYPDAWGSKNGFMCIYIGTIVFSALVFIGSGLILPKLPDYLINLPNKDYWLAPERRLDSLAYMCSHLLWLGSVSLVFLLFVFHQSFMVHLGRSDKLNYTWLSTGIFVSITIFWCIMIYFRFRKNKS